MIKQLTEAKRSLFAIDYNNISEEEILLRKKNITNYKKNNDGTFDVYHDMSLENIDSIPFQLNMVDGDFVICNNKNLTSLKGSPKTVTGSFFAYNCNLTSLEGSPKEVRNFSIFGNNNLTSLKCSPKIVTGDFYAYNCNLKSLEGSPEEVRDFYISDNKNLTSLKGCPKIVTGDFNAYNCNLTSLEGLPKTIGGYLDLSGNPLKTTKEEIRKICDVKYIIL